MTYGNKNQHQCQFNKQCESVKSATFGKHFKKSATFGKHFKKSARFGNPFSQIVANYKPTY